MLVEIFGDRWQILESTGSGKQGSTHRVSDLTGSTSTPMILKELNDQHDAERRRRMHREVAAMQSLSHPRIPRVCDSNTALFESTEKLYVVMDFIAGSTLAKYVAQHGPMAVADAVQTMLGITEVVSHCHERGVVHRDIKPDNIIIRANNIHDPVLLDFGFAFNRDEPTNNLNTESGQRIGNHFLILPELQSNSADKRSPVSDLSMCCGILHFMLTGSFPVQLADEQNQAPHRREKYRAIANTYSTQLRSRLDSIFDKGFAMIVAERFQSAKDLHLSLRSLADALLPGASAESNPSSLLRERLASFQASGEYAARTSGMMALQELFSTIENSLRTFAPTLGEGWRGLFESGGDTPSRLWYHRGYSLFHTMYTEKRVAVSYEGQIFGSEIVIFATKVGTTVREEIYRYPLGASPDHDQLDQALRRPVEEALLEKL